MGNRICGVGRRGAVEERLTKPQRLVRQPSNVDYRKLRKLILSQKLAPCFDALEDPSLDLEECPICFFYYPSLNRSRCCSKGICTECFLQMKPSNATRPAQYPPSSTFPWSELCPFCKTSSYAVEYRGARTKEEKELELAEEQKVIEAKIRMQSQEPQDVEQSVPVNRVCSILDVESPRPCSKEQSTGNLLVTRDSTLPLVREGIEVDSSLASSICNPRFDELDVDLEEIMVTEAIWRSLQDSKRYRGETAEASGTGRRFFGGGDSEVNQSRPCPALDQCEASSSSSDYYSRSEVAEPIYNVVPGSRKPCEESTQESDGTECPENCSYTEDGPSLGRSAELVEETGAAEAAFVGEGGLSAEAETRSCGSGYLHSVSGSPCDSPAFPSDGGGRGFPQLPGLLVERPMMIVMES